MHQGVLLSSSSDFDDVQFMLAVSICHAAMKMLFVVWTRVKFTGVVDACSVTEAVTCQACTLAAMLSLIVLSIC